MLKALIVITVFLGIILSAWAVEYKTATEDDIKKMLAEKKEKPGVKISRTSYQIIITDSHDKTTYYFTDTGHFAHPSVVIERLDIKKQTEVPGSERDITGITASKREVIEKWVRVLNKPYQAIERMKQEIDPRSVCQIFPHQSKEELECYEKVARDNPDSVTAHFFLGVQYIYADDELATRKQYEILKQNSLVDAVMFVGFGVAAMKPEWLEYYEKDQKQVETVSEVQQLLDSLGYDTGLLVGSVSPKLEAAIRAFQHDSDLPANGEVNDALLKELRNRKK
jgi:hypothetical protein